MKTNITLKGMALATGLTLALSAAGVANANLAMPYGSGTTTYSVMNAGSAPATVVATYYNPNGTTSLSSSHNLPVNGRLDITVGQDGPLPPNWSGSVVLSSDQDIVAVARTKYTGRADANETDPNQTSGTESSAYEAFNSGSTALYFPVIVRIKRAAQPTVAQLTTRFTVQNTSASPATVYLNFRNFNGTTYPPQIITLNGYGSRTWDTAVDSDLTPPVPASDLAPNVVQFSLFVTGTQPLVGVAEQSWNFDGFIGATPVKQNWAADYAAIPASEAATTLYGPLVSRIGGPPIGSSRPCTFSVYTTFFFYTQFAVQNTTATTATVTATFIRSNTGTGANAPSGQATGSYTVQVPPFGTWNVGTFNGGNLGINKTASSFWNIFADGYNAGTGGATHCNWSGSVVFTSDQPIVGFGFVQQPLSIQNYASGFNFFGAGGATSRALLPRADRVCTPNTSNVCPVNEIWRFTDFSGLVVQNVGNANTNLTLTFYNSNGTPNQTFTVDGSNNSITLAPGQQYTFNTRNGANASIAQTQALGNNFKGTVVVTATNNVPIRIFNLLISGMDDADAYIGFNR
jgi:hypothetical protein